MHVVDLLFSFIFLVDYCRCDSATERFFLALLSIFHAVDGVLPSDTLNCAAPVKCESVDADVERVTKMLMLICLLYTSPSPRDS